MYFLKNNHAERSAKENLNDEQKTVSYSVNINAGSWVWIHVSWNSSDCWVFFRGGLTYSCGLYVKRCLLF